MKGGCVVYLKLVKLVTDVNFWKFLFPQLECTFTNESYSLMFIGPCIIAIVEE